MTVNSALCLSVSALCWLPQSGYSDVSESLTLPHCSCGSHSHFHLAATQVVEGVGDVDLKIAADDMVLKALFLATNWDV